MEEVRNKFEANIMTYCVGSCSKQPKNPRVYGGMSGLPNEKNQIVYHCKHCGVYFLRFVVDGVRCDCCKMRMRSKPRNSKSRQKMKEKRY